MLLFNQVLLIFEFYFAFQSLFFPMRGSQNTRHPNSFFLVSHVLRMMGRQKSKGKAAVPFVVVWKHGPRKLLAVTADLQIRIQFGAFINNKRSLCELPLWFPTLN